MSWWLLLLAFVVVNIVWPVLLTTVIRWLESVAGGDRTRDL